MQSGNIEPRTTVTMDYLDCSRPPFIQTAYEKRIIIRPHQTGSLGSPNREYRPLELECPINEVNCVCLSNNDSTIFDKFIDPLGINATLLWLDPRFLPAECLASLVANWKKRLVAAQKVALGIVVPKGNTSQKIDAPYELWKADVSGPLYRSNLGEPIWYPSLARESNSLNRVSENLDPYDVFPLVEFPHTTIESGEKALTDHCFMLEKFRTRTRNFIYLDVSRPDQAFQQFYGTIEALPRTGSSIFQPVITPGGSANGFLTALLSGVFAESHFYTPKGEIPINSNAEAQGIMILRKCT